MRIKALLLTGNLILSLLAPVATTMHAQRVAGAGDNAIPVARGKLRWTLGATWNRYRDAFQRPDGSGLERLPLLSELDVSEFGTRELPQLAAAEEGLRTLTGTPSFRVSLGPLDTRAEVQENITPFSVEYGLTRRLSLGVTVPYVEARTVTGFALNRAGVDVNVGENPAWAASGMQARTANGRLLREISAAQQALTSELMRCQVPEAEGCELIVGQGTAIQTLLARASRTERALSAVYGDSLKGGSPVAPIRGSDIERAVFASIASLREDFAAFGVDAIGEQSLPVSSGLVYGSAGFRRLAGDSALGLGYVSLGNTRRSGIGDIDIAATFLLFDSFDFDETKRLASAGRGARSALTLGWRFGSGNLPRAGHAFDLGTGLGTSALLFRSVTDIILDRRTWVSISLRGTKPMSDQAVITLPPENGANLMHPFQAMRVTRDFGIRSSLELTPRYTISDFFGLSVLYRLARGGEDSYTPDVLTDDSGQSDEGFIPAPRYTVPVRSLQSVGFAISYSSLVSHSRGKSRLPVELTYSHLHPMSAGGDLVPAVATDRLELRLYTGFRRR